MVQRDPDPVYDIDPDPEDEIDPDPDELADLTVRLPDSPASLDAWLQVSRLMSQLEEAFTWLSEIEAGLRENPPSKSRIRRGARQLTRCFDAVALSMPSIAVQVAASLSSVDHSDYDRYIHLWYERMRLHHNRHSQRYRL